MTNKLFSSFTVVISLIFTAANSQNFEADRSSNVTGDLKGTHSVSLHAGYQLIRPEVVLVESSGSGTKAKTNIIGTVSYQYWLENHSAIHLTTGIFSAESNVNRTHISTFTIIPVLFGYSFYPENLALGNYGRTHFGANLGTYIKTDSAVIIGADNVGANSSVEAMFGAELQTGIDFFPSKWLRIGPELSYHFFNENYSGPAFSFTLGLLL